MDSKWWSCFQTQSDNHPYDCLDAEKGQKSLFVKSTGKYVASLSLAERVGPRIPESFAHLEMHILLTFGHPGF